MNKRLMFIWTATLTFMCLSAPAMAQIALDGTFGAGGALSGPDYTIDAGLGSQVGGNLFHSFSDFNIQTGESATFTGPPSVANIIGRVTGGQLSTIDGVLRSTIPQADVYLINPAGMAFGPNAVLDVRGSFHAATADVISLEDGGRFDARVPDDSLLTTAPVTGFGFISPTPAPLSANGAEFSLPVVSTLSLMGGGLNLQDTQVFTPSGRINLASVSGPGSVNFAPAGLEVQAPGGDITLTDTNVQTSGEGGGAMFIQGGRLVLSNTRLQADTLGAVDARGIAIDAENILLDSTFISTTTRDAGQAGLIGLRAEGDILIQGVNDRGFGSTIFSESSSIMDQAGAAGAITLEAARIRVADGARISSSTMGSGAGGNVSVSASETLVMEGLDRRGVGPSIVSETGDPMNPAASTGAVAAAGDVSISAGSLSLDDGSVISTNTFSSGAGGTLSLHIDNDLVLQGANTAGSASMITASASGGPMTTGDAGDIVLSAPRITLFERTGIRTEAVASGGGNITINMASGNGSLLHLPGGEISTSVRIGVGSGGNINIASPEFVVLNGGRITAQADAGSGGDIAIVTDQFIQSPDSVISASSRRSLDGRIAISSPESDVTADLAVLQTRFDTSKLLRPECAARLDELTSSFVVAPPAGVPSTPEEMAIIALRSSSPDSLAVNAASDCGDALTP